jgi:hypothetical protein
MDKTVLKWFGGGFGAAFGVATALVVSAATGDLVYEEVQEPVSVIGQKAVDLGQAMVATGAWSGTADGILGCSSSTDH